MLTSYIPRIEDLWFRKLLLADSATMAYNHTYGGMIEFPQEEWPYWHDWWVARPDGKRFYRYVQEEETGEPVGEISYHFNGSRYICGVIIHAGHRGKGYGRQALRLLCGLALENGLDALYDDIAIDNREALELFRSEGFTEEYRADGVVMLKKVLG